MAVEVIALPYNHRHKRRMSALNALVCCISFGLSFSLTICISQSHYSHSEEYHTDSSRGSDLSDIMEEDEEELYSEMQHEEGRRRNSHNALKVSQKAKDISQYPNDILVCMAVTTLLSSRFKTGGSTQSSSQLDRDSYRKPSHRGPQPQRRPLTVPSIGQCSPSKRQVQLLVQDLLSGPVCPPAPHCLFLNC